MGSNGLFSTSRRSCASYSWAGTSESIHNIPFFSHKKSANLHNLKIAFFFHFRTFFLRKSKKCENVQKQLEVIMARSQRENVYRRSRNEVSEAQKPKKFAPAAHLILITTIQEYELHYTSSQYIAARVVLG